MITKLFLLAVKSPSIRRAIWKPIYNFLARRFPYQDWHFMNYGYTPFPHEPELNLPDSQEFTRYQIQLYHYLACKGEVAGKDVLEVGSGRGGGAMHIARNLNPAYIVGMDIAEKAVEFCNQTHRLPNLRYVQGDAENIPFKDNSFDVVINVESSHAYGNVPRFISEVKRVLRPGGYFLITDIKLAPDMSILKKQLKQSGMEILEEESITENVVRAIEMEDPIKQERIRTRIPNQFQSLFAEFAGGVNSEIHASLKNRVRTYYRFVLQKSALLLFLCFGIFQTGFGQKETSPLLPATTISSIEFNQPNPLELLMQYIQYPSLSGEEDEAGNFLMQTCRDMGFSTRLFRHPDGHFNFTASIYSLDLKKPNLIFLTHIDVVAPGDLSEWRHPPFEGNLINGEIWGRGAFDNKGLTIIQLIAISKFLPMSRKVDLPYNLTLLAVSCEETQCGGGAKYLADSFLTELNPYAVLGEGIPPIQKILTSDPERYFHTIGVNHKRPLWLKLDLEIATHGHGSVTPESYANQEMIRSLNHLIKRKPKGIFTETNVQFLKDLGKLEKGFKGFVLRHPRLFKPLILSQLYKQPEVFALFSNSITITSLHNPVAQQNLIPEKISCLLDCRLLPDADEKHFLKKLKRRLKNPEIQVCQLLNLPSAFDSPTTHPVYEKMNSTIREYHREPDATPLFLPNYSDLIWFRLKGVPTYNVAPFKVSREQLAAVHAANERISVSSIYEGIAVFCLFLEKIEDQKL